MAELRNVRQWFESLLRHAIIPVACWRLAGDCVVNDLELHGFIVRLSVAIVALCDPTSLPRPRLISLKHSRSSALCLIHCWTAVRSHFPITSSSLLRYEIATYTQAASGKQAHYINIIVAFVIARVPTVFTARRYA